MGNTQTPPSKLQSLNTHNWVEAGQNHQNAIFSNVNPFRKRLLANIITHQLIEQYQLNFITQEDYNSYLAELTYRQLGSSQQQHKLNSPQHQKLSDNTHYSQTYSFIYPIRYFLNKSKHQMCTTIHTGYLYLDKVELRLKQINDIPFQDLLYMYKATLNGFKLLYQKVGYFDILEEMIFITKSGHVKVWMNPNLAKNYPNYQKNNYNSNQTSQSQREPQNIYGSQADMIRKLILMIEKNSDEFIESSHHSQSHNQNELFSQYLQDRNIFDKLSFQHSLDEFQNYLSRNNMHCPNFMRSIPQLFSPDDHNYNPDGNYEQSHVNQITSQHLTQMKKKYQPMQIIEQDEKINSRTTNKMRNSNQRDKIQESQVATYTPHTYSNHRQITQTQSNSRNILLPLPSKSPFMELNNSRHSQQSNSVNIMSNDYMNLQKTSKSYANNTDSQKGNSGSALSFNSNIQSQQHHREPYFGVSNVPNVVILPPPVNGMNGNVTFVHPTFPANQHQLHGHYGQEGHSQRIFMVSPPPSFRIMSTMNNLPFQQQVIANQNQNHINLPNHHHINYSTNNVMSQHHTSQPINLPPPGPASSYNTSHVSSQRGFQQQNIQQHQKKQIKRFTPQKQNNNIKSMNHTTHSNQKGGFGVSKQDKQTYLSRSNQNKGKLRSSQNYKVKYFTKNESYQLDEEIANDLQKFLGLKVN